jgi:hypothetical protein
VCTNGPRLCISNQGQSFYFTSGLKETRLPDILRGSINSVVGHQNTSFLYPMKSNSLAFCRIQESAKPTHFFVWGACDGDERALCH